MRGKITIKTCTLLLYLSDTIPIHPKIIRDAIYVKRVQLFTVGHWECNVSASGAQDNDIVSLLLRPSIHLYYVQHGTLFVRNFLRFASRKMSGTCLIRHSDVLWYRTDTLHAGVHHTWLVGNDVLWYEKNDSGITIKAFPIDCTCERLSDATDGRTVRLHAGDAGSTRDV